MMRATSHEAMFGELRSLLQQEPGAHAWTRICGLLRRWPDPERLREQVLPYAQAQLARWPDALRKVPWRERGASGSPEAPWLSLCRKATFYLEPDRQLSSAALSSATHLSLNARGDEHARLRAALDVGAHPIARLEVFQFGEGDAHATLAALEPAWARGVRALDLTFIMPEVAHLGATAEAMARAALPSLSLTNMELEDAHLALLLDAGALRACQALRLDSNKLSAATVEALLTHERAPVMLRELLMSSNFGAAPHHVFSPSWEALLSRHAETLQQLNMSFSSVDRAWLDQTLAARPLRALERLELRHATVSAETMAALAQLGAQTPTLRTLDLSYCVSPLGVDAFEPWRQHEALPWRELNLTRCNLTDAHLATLAACPALSNLEVLKLDSNQLTAEGLRALVHSPHLTRLHTLHLSENHLGAEGARLLATAPNLAGLRELELRSAHIPPAGITFLAMSETLRLEHLNLSNTHAEPELWRALGRAPIVARAHALLLGRCGLDAARLEALLAGGQAQHLRLLSMSDNPLGADGARALLDAGSWPALDGLVISDTQQTPQSLTALATAESLSDVSMIIAGHQPIDSATMSMLATCHPVLNL